MLAFGLASILLLILIVGPTAWMRVWHRSHNFQHEVILLDPGHGGKDAGAIAASGAQEKDINLAIAKRLRHYLQQAGATVYLTRESDRDLAGERDVPNRKRLDLAERARLVQARHATLVLTIHLNAMPDPTWRGAQTFYSKSANVLNQTLATTIQDELTQRLGNTNREARAMRTPIYLLRKSDVPTALVECGFLSNVDEARLLTKEKYQDKIAVTLYRALLRYDLEVGYNGKRIR